MPHPDVDPFAEDYEATFSLIEMINNRPQGSDLVIKSNGRNYLITASQARRFVQDLRDKFPERGAEIDKIPAVLDETTIPDDPAPASAEVSVEDK